MRISKLFDFRFYKNNHKEYVIKKNIDEYAVSTFHGGNGKLTRAESKTIEWRITKLYRKYQANYNTIWRYYYAIFCRKYIVKFGVDIFSNPNIGDALVIGHRGRIIVSGDAVIGEQFMITHGVTIGRDIRGKRKGVPIIGDRVCIRANSTVVGKIIIADDVLIAPNTFVNFDVPSHSIVIGNPARIIHKDNATEGHIGKKIDM